MYWALRHATAGLWPLIWHWGPAIGIVILCLIAEVAIGWFSATVPFIEKFLKPFQKDLWWVAALCVAYLYVLNMGINIEAERCKAQTAVVQEQADSVVDEVLKQPLAKDAKSIPADAGQCKDC